MEKEACRPSTITCRWLREITESIHNVCSSIEPITECNDPEIQFRDFVKNRVENHSCSDTVEKILRYEVDYNDYRK